MILAVIATQTATVPYCICLGRYTARVYPFELSCNGKQLDGSSVKSVLMVPTSG